MLDGLFLSVLNMSITASLVILVVLLVRLLLKKAPKTFSYALWIVVLFRLICPFSFESAIGLLPINKTPIPQDIMYSTEPQIDTGINIVDSIVNPILPVANNMGESINPLQVWVFVGSTIWVFGMLIMLIYSIIQFVRLKRKLVGATPLRGNIYLADHISSPFVMGFIKPNIYLPSSMAKTEQAFIIAHENYHIKRFDHIARILGFIALTIHWLNPLVWLAFVLSGKDMEMSCDEAVMREMDTDIRAEYSKSLLRFATGRKIIAATPLAFGEGDTKERVKNVMQYKKPILWVSIIAVIAVVCVVVGLMSNSKSEPASTQTGNQSIEQLWENRTEYVGNNVAVGNIILGLSFPEKLKYNGIELHTSEPPYSITVDFETDTDTRNFYTGELNQTPLKQNAIIMFSLIENVEQIIFNFDDGKNPYAETFYRDSAQAIMEDENLFARTETLESFISFIEEISIKLDVNTDVQSNSQRDMKYKTESEFLNSPDGVKFQSTAYKAAKAYLSGNTDELLQYATESLTIDTTHDLFKDIDYMILKWSLDDIKDKDKIHAAYEFKLKGDDSVSYVSMELIRLDSEWKVDTVGMEK